MTEKSLLLKCDFADHYFVVGTDFPAARVFDTTTSALTAVVELPLRSRTISLAALTLTSVAIARVHTSHHKSSGPATARHATEQLVDDAVAVYYAAVGLSNGTLLLHDVRRDALVAHVQVSETQQPLIALQLCGDLAFCLAANNTLYAVRLHDAAAGPCWRVRVQPDASSIAATMLLAAEGDADHAMVYRVMVAGPTNALYEVRTLAQQPHHPSSTTGAAVGNPRDTSSAVHGTKLLAFPSQGTAAEFAWVSDAAAVGQDGGVASLPAVTASAQDGVVRVWDLQYENQNNTNNSSHVSSAVPGLVGASQASSAGNAALVARCRRTLLCGQRILNVSVLPAPLVDADQRTGGAATAARKENYIMVTTLTGSVLLWSLGEALLPAVVEPMPLKPDVVLVSAVASGKLLFASLRAAQAEGRGVTSPSSSAVDEESANAAASADALRGLELTLLRGRFAMPLFETTNVGAAVAAAAAALPATTAGGSAAAANANAARRTALSTLALGVVGNTAITVVELPLHASSEAALAEQQDVAYLLDNTTDAATSAFVVMDTVWAAHQQQVAAKASQSMSEAFKAPQLFHARSIQDLPVKQLTLEQRLQQVAREEAAAARQRKTRHLAGAAAEDAGADALEDGRSVLSHHALGLATIPLYQALHANDTSAVMDLLNMTSRSAEGMRATVLSLQLPYCLQLLQVLSERLGLTSKAVEKAAAPTTADNATTTAADKTNSAASTHNASGEQQQPGEAAAEGVSGEEGHSSKDSGVLRGGVAAFSIRSSLLEWVDAILTYRGSELLAVQQEWNARAARQAAGQRTAEDAAADAVSPPKDFLAPILHHYRELCAQYDKLAVLYGRLSIFKSVRPSQKNEFTNVPRQSLGSNIEMARPTLAGGAGAGLATSSGSGSHARARRLHLAEKSSVVDSDIIFPVMFKEARARSGHRVVRVRSKLQIEKRKKALENKDAALQKRARALARQELRARAAQGASSILDDDHGHGSKLDVMDQIMMEEMKGGDGELDLDALEAMDLGADSDLDGSDANLDDEEDEEEEGESDEEESGDLRGRRTKKSRQEVVDEMLADDKSGEAQDGSDAEDADAGLDSSEAEFSSASDDEVRSDVLDEDSSEDDEAEEEEEDEEEEGDDDLHDLDGGSGDEDDEDDGMGEAMQELLARHEDDDDRTERRKTKKVRTD